MEKEKKKGSKPGCIVLIVILLFIIGVIGSCVRSITSKSSTATNISNNTEIKPKSLNDLVAEYFTDGKITIEGDKLTITFTGSQLSANSIANDSITRARIGLSQIYKNDEFKKYNLIEIDAMGTFTDQYGKASSERAVGFIFDQAELQKVVNFNVLTDEQIIGLEGKNRTFINPVIIKDLDAKTLNKLHPNN
ncbi:MAG: hypothetical protein K0R54_4311 [Clostridiaceae bacterium]|jgi:hypothetical protein|nr:hypothetical protein [Clostridiaceae bacterium]